MAKSTSLAAALASLAACTAAFILPNQQDRQQQQQQPLGVPTLRGGSLQQQQQQQHPISSSSSSSSLPSILDDAFPVSIDIEPIHAAIDSLLDQVQSARHRIHDEFAKVVISTSQADSDLDQDASPDLAPLGDHEPSSFFDLSPLSAAPGGPLGGSLSGNQFDKVSLYTLMSQSSQCEHFLKLVDMFPEIVALLNNTENDLTVFVPSPDAFKHIPEDHDKVPKELIEKVVRYHIAVGRYEVKRIAATYTIPTSLKEEALGDEPQRLRVSFSLKGVSMNFYSKVVRANMHAKNGVLHAVDHIIIPPPYIGRIITLFPSRFSTELLAMEKSNFVDFIHKQKIKGTTTFIPTNAAWARLGDRANAFLFNTKKGATYLKALLKYQAVPDITLYTDAIYDKSKDGKHGDDDDHKKHGKHGDDGKEMEPSSYDTEHYDLPTFLGDARLGVDVAHVFGFAVVKVNGFTMVIVPNVPAKNGVIHVVDRVPLPPCRRHGKNNDEHMADDEDLFGEIEVEDLMDRLEPYLE